MSERLGCEPGAPVVRLNQELAWDRETDVVVIGSGVAGSSAAVNCADLGLEVLVLEKGLSTGGTSAKSTAAAWVPNNRFLQELGLDDPKGDFVRLLARLGRPLLYDPSQPTFGLPQWEYDLIEAYYDHAATAWAHVEEIGAAKIAHWPDWPSATEVPEDRRKTGRMLFPLGDDGQFSNGRVAIDRMLGRATELGGEVLVEFRVDGLYINEKGHVVGVRGLEQGKPVSIRARRAVVLATGGFTHSERYAREHLGGQYVGGCAARTNTGDILPIMQSLGVPLFQMHAAWGAAVVWEQSLDRDPALIANFAFPGDSILTVNKYGLRVGNEKMQYNDRAGSHLVWDPARAEYPNFLQFVVMDERCRETFASKSYLDREAGNFIPPVGAESNYLLEGETLEALAAQFAARLESRANASGGIQLADDFVDQLHESVQRFNRFARRGVDEDFHRGEKAVERILESAEDNTLPNPALFPLSEHGPYYGTILAPGAMDTKGGPKVNASLQVLNGVGEPIPGLYGIGNCVASASGQAYWSSGSTWGPYLTFGYVAARRIAHESVKTLEQPHSVVG